ncbi:MAG: hypothetical protein PV358_07790 [Acidimicrobiales bacterium]|nr:hypothetical protein [Acidimicrobiales bacterium]
MGATLIAASVVVLVIGMAWLNRSDPPRDRLATPMVDGVTLPTDRDGNAVDVPPSQPAVAVSFGGGGEILRPDPVRARIVDDSGREVIVPLAPNTTVDTVTGAIVPKSTTTTRRPGTTDTTRRTTTSRGTTPTTGSTTTTETPTTGSTTTETPTTESTTTTETTTTTTETTTTEPTDPSVLGLLGDLLP